MDMMAYVVDFFKDLPRQGPGSREATIKALHAIPGYQDFANILDFGCGTGGQTLTLLEQTSGHVIAVDLLAGFLSVLQEKAARGGFSERLTTREMPMDQPDFAPGSFDLIWAEGSIYNIGFETGLRNWKDLLKPGGYMAVSEIGWLKTERPEALHNFWTNAYPQIDTIANKLAVIERCGYMPVTHFVLPECCWRENYYAPIRAQADAFVQKHGGTAEVRAFVKELLDEANLYDRYKDDYSYVFYVMKAQ